VLTSGVRVTARKARGKIRRLTRALGTVRELDVTLQLLDEMVANETLPRPALEAVRGRVVAERDASGHHGHRR
jgi:CHAD domain-containing protein